MYIDGISFFGSFSYNKLNPFVNVQKNILQRICLKNKIDNDNLLFATYFELSVYETYVRENFSKAL